MLAAPVAYGGPIAAGPILSKSYGAPLLAAPVAYAGIPSSYSASIQHASIPLAYGKGLY